MPAAAGSAGRRPRRCPEPSCRSRVLLVAPSELESVGGMQRHEIRSVLTLPLPRGCRGGDSAMRAVWRRLCDGAELSGMAEVGRLEWDADAEEVRVAAGRLSLRLEREDGAAGELHLEWAYQAQRLAEAIFGCLSNP